MMNRKNFGGASASSSTCAPSTAPWFDADELPQVLEFVQTGGLVRERARELERERLARATTESTLGGARNRPRWPSIP